MADDAGKKCQCPLLSVHCDKQTVRRERWIKAVKGGELDGIKKLIGVEEGRYERDFLRLTEQSTKNSCLHFAAQIGSEDVMTTLLGRVKASLSTPAKLINFQNSKRMTPLMVACLHGRKAIVEMLLAAGAMTHYMSVERMRASQYADLNGHAQIARAVRLKEDTTQATDDWSEEVVDDRAGEGRGGGPQESRLVRDDENAGDQGREDGEATPDDAASDSGEAAPIVGEKGVGDVAESSVVKKAKAKADNPLSAMLSAASGTARQAAHIKKLSAGTHAAQARMARERAKAEAEERAKLETQERIHWLDGASFFNVLSVEQMQQMCAMGSTHRLRYGDFLRRESGQDFSMFVVVSGDVRCVVKRKTGVRLEMVEISMGEGESFGESTLLTGDPVNVAFNPAMGDAIIAEVSKASLTAILDLPLVEILADFLAQNLTMAMESVGAEMDKVDYDALVEEMQYRIVKFHDLEGMEVEEPPPVVVDVAPKGFKHTRVNLPRLETPSVTKGGVNLVHSLYFEDAGEFPERAAVRRERPKTSFALPRPRTTAGQNGGNGSPSAGIVAEGVPSRQASRPVSRAGSKVGEATEEGKGGSRPQSSEGEGRNRPESREGGAKSASGEQDGEEVREGEDAEAEGPAEEVWVSEEGDRGTGAKAFVQACKDMDGHFPLQSAIIQLGRKSVVLQGMRLIAKDGMAFGAALGTPNLFVKHVNVSQNDLGDKGCCGDETRSMPGLLQGVQKSWSGEGGGVTGLDISCVNAGHATGRVLGEILSGGGSLLSLNGSRNKLGCGPKGGGAAEIARGMAAGAGLGSGLTSLNLSNNKITSAGAVALGAMLFKNTSLRSLDLGWNHIFPDGAEAIFSALRKHPGIDTLSMEWNRVGDRGGTALGELLQSNKTLVRLDVCNCRMGDECCEELSEGLKTTKSLEVFKADGNAFGHGKRLILDVLTRSTIKYSIEGCKYDGDQLKHDYEEGNATGGYRIDLANSHQVGVLEKLLEMARLVGSESWRNERLDGKRFSLSSDGSWDRPEEGILTMDIVDRTIASDDEKVLDPHDFERMCEHLLLITNSSGKLNLVRQAVKEHVLNAGQALVVLGEFVRERDREECLVAIFSRIRGRKSALPRILLKHFDRMTVSLSIQQRLGVADAFDEFRPAGKYRLDLAKPDDREVLLRLLAIRDSGLFEGRECKWQFETPVYYPDPDHFQGSQPVDMDQYGEWIRAQVEAQENGGVISRQPSAMISRVASSQSKQPAPSRTQSASNAGRTPSSQSPARAPSGSPSQRPATGGVESGEGEEGEEEVPFSVPETGFVLFDFTMQLVPQLNSVSLMDNIHKSALRKRQQTQAQLAKPKTPPVVESPKSANRGFFQKPGFRRSGAFKHIEDDEQSEPSSHGQSSIVPLPRRLEQVELMEKQEHQRKKTEARRRKAETKGFDIIHQANKEKQEVFEMWLSDELPPRSWGELERMRRETTANANASSPPRTPGEAPGSPTSVADLQNAERKWRPWLGFKRIYKEDFAVKRVVMKARQLGTSGLQEVVYGSLPESSCANYEIDLSAPIRVHTIPRYISFTVSPALEADLYANTTGLPWEESYVWKGELGGEREKTILIRPQDPNYRDVKYFVSIITTAKPQDYMLTISVTPYAPTIKEGAEKLRESREKARLESTGGQVMFPQEKGIHLQKEDAAAAGKVLHAILNFTEDRKRKGAMGARVPPKNELNVLRPRGQTADSSSRGASRGGSPNRDKKVLPASPSRDGMTPAQQRAALQREASQRRDTWKAPQTPDPSGQSPHKLDRIGSTRSAASATSARSRHSSNRG